jgi:hypothetical protein
MTKINNPGPGPVAASAESAPVLRRFEGSVARECFAAFLSLLIVGFTLYFMWAMFSDHDDVAAMRWQHQSSVLQTALGLTGAVVGYYFARIPAERAVSVAQRSEAAAVSSAEQAVASKSRMLGSVQEIFDDYSTPHGGGDDHVNSEPMRAEVAQRLAQILRMA